ncbi:DUF4184 family protein [Phytohabitans sp. LJ34]|uniref:DUF4184 family protein n=1 Tax=Phytohabitans sp. LJ34 TaxID=3452217 RepID=UPI003F8A0754
MPFTGSHPAAVLPLIRWGLPPSALVIGSMAPDLPYYLPAPVDGATTHSLAGVFGADLVLGLVMLGVWQALLAPFAAAIGPAALRDRLHPPAPGRPRPAARAVLVVVALTLGAATHVVWDSFTHVGRWGPAHIDWLAESHAGLPGYRWAQYASGVAGAAAIALWLARWWRATSPTARRPAAPRAVAAASWTLIALATATGALFAALPALRDADHRDAAFLAITRGGGAGLLTAALCATLVLPARVRGTF